MTRLHTTSQKVEGAYDGKEDGRLGHADAIRHIRAKGLREGIYTPRNDEERAIAEGRDQ